jgi:hypothetical protein
MVVGKVVAHLCLTLIIKDLKFSVVTTLPCSTLIYNSLTISVGHKCVVTFPTVTSLIMSFFVFHIFTNIKFVHVTSPYYHS